MLRRNIDLKLIGASWYLRHVFDQKSPHSFLSVSRVDTFFDFVAQPRSS